MLALKAAMGAKAGEALTRLQGHYIGRAEREVYSGSPAVDGARQLL